MNESNFSLGENEAYRDFLGGYKAAKRAVVAPNHNLNNYIDAVHTKGRLLSNKINSEDLSAKELGRVTGYLTGEMESIINEERKGEKSNWGWFLMNLDLISGYCKVNTGGKYPTNLISEHKELIRKSRDPEEYRDYAKGLNMTLGRIGREDLKIKLN